MRIWQSGAPFRKNVTSHRVALVAEPKSIQLLRAGTSIRRELIESRYCGIHSLVLTPYVRIVARNQIGNRVQFFIYLVRGHRQDYTCFFRNSVSCLIADP